MLRCMKRIPVVVVAVALFAVACAPGAPSSTSSPIATAPAVSALPSVQVSASPALTVPTAPVGSPAVTQTVDYTGDWHIGHLAGTLKYCGATAHPYWANDMVSSSGDRGFMSYLIPAGSTDPVAGILDTPFIVPDWNDAAAGTGQFVPGDPAHFIVVTQEGSFNVTLASGKFCATQ